MQPPCSMTGPRMSSTSVNFDVLNISLAQLEWRLASYLATARSLPTAAAQLLGAPIPLAMRLSQRARWSELPSGTRPIEGPFQSHASSSGALRSRTLGGARSSRTAVPTRRYVAAEMVARTRRSLALPRWTGALSRGPRSAHSYGTNWM